MSAEGPGCGQVHALYVAARNGDEQAVRRHWDALNRADLHFDERASSQLEEAIEAADLEAVRRQAAQLLFADEETAEIDGLIADLVEAVLYRLGYLAAFVLFFRASSREAVVRRLRWAYRAVGVDIRDTETVDGVERTVFRCPYRNLGADRWGRRHACHDVLDRVDDGYVTFLERHRDIDYQRPRACRASECCYSEVAEE